MAANDELLEDFLGMDKGSQASSPHHAASANVSLIDSIENDKDTTAAAPGSAPLAYTDETLTLGKMPDLSDFPESNVKRDTLDVSSCKVEAVAKTTIYVLSNGVTTAVSWHQDTPAIEVQQAVLCACNCIHSGGVQLIELHTLQDDAELKTLRDQKEDQIGGKLLCVQQDGVGEVWYKKGLTLDFEEFRDSLVHNQLYLLTPAREREELTSITGDSLRRILLKVPALTHVEAERAVKAMRTGANLIKKTRLDVKHFRFYQLSPDLRRLVWYTSKKKLEESTLNLSDVTEVKVNQYDQTATMNEIYRLFSFTVFSKKFVLDLCAKDEEEFDNWVTGFKALAAHFHDVQLNKVQLLGHSRAFRRQLAEARLLPESECKLGPAEVPAIHKIIDLRVGTRAKAIERLNLLKEQLRFLEIKHAAVDRSALRDPSLVINPPPDCPMVDPGEATKSDSQLEYDQAKYFIDDCKQRIMHIEQLLDQQLRESNANPAGLTPEANAKVLEQINHRLWETQMNIETTNDMVIRLTTPTLQPSVASTITAIQRQFEEGKEKIVKTWAQFASSYVAPTVQKIKAFTEDSTEDGIPDPDS